MVAFPALKFILLGVRQFTRPVVRHIVRHAMDKRGLVYQQCMILGRISLGLSSVMAEWSRNELLKKAEVMSSVGAQLHAQAAPSSSAGTTTTSTTAPRSPTAAATTDATSPTTASHDENRKKAEKDEEEANARRVPDMETKRLMNEAMAIAEGKDIPAAIHAAAAATLASVTGSSGGGGVGSSGGAGHSMSNGECSAGQGGRAEVTMKIDIRPAATKVAAAAAAAVVTPRSRLLMENIVNDQPSPSPSHGTSHTEQTAAAAAAASTTSNTTTRSPSSSNTSTSSSSTGSSVWSWCGRLSRTRTTKSSENGSAALFVKSRRAGAAAAARLFLRNPYRSTWYVFHKTFFAPFPLPQLLNAGAELLIELIVFLIFAVLLFGELQQQARNAARKEAYYNAKLDETVAKVNELVRVIQGRHPQANVHELHEWPQFISRGRLEALTEGARSTLGAVAGLVRKVRGGEPTS